MIRTRFINLPKLTRAVTASYTFHLEAPCDAAVMRYPAFMSRRSGNVSVHETIPGEFEGRFTTGFGSWAEDRVAFHPSGAAGTDVTYQRIWHASIYGRIAAPVARLAWRSTFGSWHRNFAHYLSNS